MKKNTFTLSDFDYSLPEKLIAQKPANPRDHSRLLVFDRKSKSITDTIFHEIGTYLTPQTTLVVNNSRVEKARLIFGKMEVFITNTVNDRVAQAMIRPGKKFKTGKTIHLANGIEATVLSIEPDGLRTLSFNIPLDSPEFEPYRRTPFPPYIAPDESLSERYQTIYAKPEGSKAAPTAGLHFTESLLTQLAAQGISKAEVTLHVGLGTFAPVKADIIEEHKLHTEEWILTDDTVSQLNKANHITAVGTTSARVLESVPLERGKLIADAGKTDIFIRPGYTFKIVDSLITNFHLPKSTLLMMIAAFMGYEEMRTVYDHAIKNEYRFYSFGDAMLII